MKYYCDGFIDCLDGEDEYNCITSLKNPDLIFSCSNSLQNISSLLVCDYIQDCSDNSDERFCGNKNFIY